MDHPRAPGENRLAGETSPYLLQHRNNPVDWYPWGEQALARARDHGLPIFLSIGYSACHWCHVMERESFEDPRMADLLNRTFVCIKVDREERPDVDEIYMKAVLRMTGQGGWPLTVFLTPELEPFYGGTYFPPSSMYGMPSFADVVTSVASQWQRDPDGVRKRSAELTGEIAAESTLDGRGDLDPGVLERAVAALHREFDDDWGGFGDAPKFPRTGDLRLLLRRAGRRGGADSERALQMVTLTLDRMAGGGIHDQLGGGFHRYSTDDEWLVPHFEKMLYDNALLIPVYLEAFLLTGEERYAEVARGCCEWALREMRTAEGGFASAQDADSEGEEGKFFVWEIEEIRDLLGDARTPIFAAAYGVVEAGNHPGPGNILWRPVSDARLVEQLGVSQDQLEEVLREGRELLFQARGRRIAPDTDDKVLTAWNGLLISALAQAYQVLGDERYLAAASAAARHVLGSMRQPDGRLFATARAGRVHVNACLDDYAFLIQGLIDLYESDFDPQWLREAVALARIVEQEFRDEELGGYFTTGVHHEQLIARVKNPHDAALPSGSGVHATNLLRLAALLGDDSWRSLAEELLRSAAKHVNQYPTAFSQFLLALDQLVSDPLEVVIAGERTAARVGELLAAVRGTYRPQRVVALATAGSDVELLPLLAGRNPGDAGGRAFVCRRRSCQEPVDTASALSAQLGA